MLERARILMPIAAIAIGAILASASSEAASFNCRYAKSAVEVAICQDEDLQALDERMAKDYSTLGPLLPYSARSKLKRSQIRFITRRNACGYNADCISAAYEARIASICNVAEKYDLSCDEFGD
jgi:uncharacterized protein